MSALRVVVVGSDAHHVERVDVRTIRILFSSVVSEALLGFELLPRGFVNCQNKICKQGNEQDRQRPHTKYMVMDYIANIRAKVIAV